MNIEFNITDIIFFFIGLFGFFLSLGYTALPYELIDLKKSGKAPKEFRYEKHYELLGDLTFPMKLLNNKLASDMPPEFAKSLRGIRIIFVLAGVFVITSFTYFGLQHPI